MNRPDNERDVVDAHLGLFRSPPAEQISEAQDRALRRLRAEATRVPPTEPARGLSFTWRFAIAGAAAAVLAAVVIALPWSSAPLVTVVDEGAYQLVDGSRVEARPGTELSFERADDGLRIRLSRGDIIVNAAKQRDGHLYVQTKDVTVSVIGTVFLVNTGQAGSRVAVIEGEVRVQRGATEHKLLPGQQVTTDAGADARPVRDEIAWSRNAAELLSLLQQAAIAQPVLSPQNADTARERFEVESIRQRLATTGNPGRSGSPLVSGQPPACGGSLRIDPRLFRASNMTVYELITIAYGKECNFAEEAPDPEAGGLLGGPDWIRTARFDIEARRPEDSSDYTTRADGSGAPQATPGPKLRRMMQTMLAERFHLALHRAMREMAVYELTLARTGLRLTPLKEPAGFTSYLGGGGLYEQIENGINPKPDYKGLIVGAISATGASMADLAEQLTRMTGRPVLNRTGVEGTFTYEFFFAPAQWRSWKRNPGEARPQLTTPSLFRVLEDELGLRLEEARRPVEVVTIDRVERPSEN